MAGHTDKRSHHLIILAHIWLFAPFIVLWLRNKGVQNALGADSVAKLQPVVVVIVIYLLVRTWLAWRDPKGLRWEYVFPPIDVAAITVVLCLSHRGPMSSIALLYFLPIIEAAGSLSLLWSGAVALLVIAGTSLSATYGMGAQPQLGAATIKELWNDQALNIVFRLYFLLVVANLMTYQALIVAGIKEKLGVAADRNRIAADMHDGVQGHLITIASQMELLTRLAQRDPVRAAEIAKEARDMARMGADELRFLVQRMRAPALAEGFIPALQQYAHNICSRNGLQLEFSVVGTVRTLDPDEEAALFRVAQEALNNVVKHAQAAEVCISLRFDHDVELVIRDNGVGFVHGSAERADGLAGMSDRLKLLGGALRVESAPNEGTIVEARV
jgi:signal transduction histidine kinase